MKTLALLPLVTIATNTGLPTIGCCATNTLGYQARNSTAVVSVSMEPFDHGCYATNTRLLTVGYHATQQYRMVSVSMELFDHGYVVTKRMLHSNDYPRS
jgi:hypothetical protein